LKKGFLTSKNFWKNFQVEFLAVLFYPSGLRTHVGPLPHKMDKCFVSRWNGQSLASYISFSPDIWGRGPKRITEALVQNTTIKASAKTDQKFLEFLKPFFQKGFRWGYGGKPPHINI
jgi:hypothetical protein